MQIRRVELKDFKRHKHFSCDFSRGTNAICGPNGAGKTSLIEAIGFALFNASPSKKMVEMIRRGGRKLEIQVDFEASADERIYRAIRTLTPGGSSVYRIYDVELNEVIASDQKECLSKLSNLMDLHPSTDLKKLYTEILAVPQGTMTSAFLAGDKERRDIFGPLLRVDEYETAHKEMQPRLLRGMEQQRSTLEGKLEANADRLLQLPTRTAELHKQQALVAAHEKDYALLEQELAQRQQHLEALEAQEKALLALEAEHKTAHTDLIRYEVEQKQAEIERQKAQEAREIVSQHLAASVRYAQAQQEEKTLLEQTRLYQRKQRTLQDKIHARSTAEIEEKRLQEQRNEQREAAEHLREIEPRLADYQTARTEQKRLEQEVTALRALRKQIVESEQKVAQQQLIVAKQQDELQRWPIVEQQFKQLHTLREQENSTRHLIDQKKLQQQEHLRRKAELEQILAETEAIKQEGQDVAIQLKQAEDEREAYAERLTHWQHEKNQALEEVTYLEVRIERERTFRAEASGGVCPFFAKHCKNLPEHQNLRDFLTQNIDQDEQDLKARQAARDKAREEEQAAREAQNAHISRYTALSQRRNDLAQQFRERRNKSTAYEKEMLDHPDVSKELAEAEAELVHIRSLLASLEGIEVTFSKLQQAQAHLTAAEQALRLDQIYLDDKRKESFEKARLEPLLLEVNQRIESMGDPEAEARQWQRIVQERTKTEKQLQSLEAKVAQLRQECASLEEEIAQLGDPETALDRVHEELRETKASYEIVLLHKEKASGLEKYEALFEKKKQDWQQVHERLVALEAAIHESQKDFDRESLQTQRNAYTDCKGRFENVSGTLKPERKRLQDIQQLVAELIALEAQQQTLKQECTSLTAALDCCQVLRKVIREAGPRMTSALIESIRVQANRIFHEITQHHDWELLWDKDFLAEIKEGEYNRSFANLSGGEQMAVALAIRLALIRELSDVRIAFFDEPTAHMDQDRRRGLARMISSISDFDQLFVISHDDTFESMTDHYIFVDDENVRS